MNGHGAMAVTDVFNLQRSCILLHFLVHKHAVSVVYKRSLSGLKQAFLASVKIETEIALYIN